MSEEKEDRDGLVLLGGLWVNAGRDGMTFLSGTFGSARILVFKNKFKKPGEKLPDYRMYIARKSKSDQTDHLADPDPLAVAGDESDSGPTTDEGPGATPF
jgi:hypothetical protein